MINLYKVRPSIFDNSRSFANGVRVANGNFYGYFTHVSSYSLFLFTALEAFINAMILPTMSIGKFKIKRQNCLTKTRFNKILLLLKRLRRLYLTSERQILSCNTDTSIIK
jgi:hypothetical protein